MSNPFQNRITRRREAIAAFLAEHPEFTEDMLDDAIDLIRDNAYEFLSGTLESVAAESYMLAEERNAEFAQKHYDRGLEVGRTEAEEIEPADWYTRV